MSKIERIEKREVKVAAEEGGMVHLYIPQKDTVMAWQSALQMSRALHAEAMKARQAEMLKQRKAG